MAKRASIEGKGADIFFGEYAPPGSGSPPTTEVIPNDSVSGRPRLPASPDETTNVPSGERHHQREGEPMGERPREPENDGTGTATRERDGAPGRETAGVAPRERSKSRVFIRQGRASDGVVRHSHDLYRDQILWINRLKLDIEVEHGLRVNGNDLVQLAVDMLRDDFEALGEQSNVISVLVLGRPRRRPRTRPSSTPAPDTEEEGT